MNEIKPDTPIITLYEPWSKWIALGWKTIETRTHNRFACLKGKRIGIHSGLKWDRNAVNEAFLYLTPERLMWTYNYSRTSAHICGGVILCTAMVEDFRELTEADSYQALIECRTKRYGLILKDIVPLNPAIVASGKQGIWYYAPE